MDVQNSKERDRFGEAYRGYVGENRVHPDRLPRLLPMTTPYQKGIDSSRYFCDADSKKPQTSGIGLIPKRTDRRSEVSILHLIFERNSLAVKTGTTLVTLSVKKCASPVKK